MIKKHRITLYAILGALMSFLTIGIIHSFAQDARETIDATARGTSTQLGKDFNVKIIINQYSTQEDRQALVNAFQKGQSQGLTNALEKMPSVGRIQIPGTVGYDLSYITTIPTDTGRKIRFVTNRRIAFGEVAQNTRSKDYSLTAGEIDINDKDSKKSQGVLLPAAQLIINNQGQLQWELYKNPWQLNNIIDWNKKE
jgi:hypothetical protein